MRTAFAAASAWAAAALAGLLLLLTLTAPHVGYPMSTAWLYVMAAAPVAFLLLGWSLARRGQEATRGDGTAKETES